MSELVIFVKQIQDAPLEVRFELAPARAADRVGDLILNDPPAQIGGQLQVEKIQGSILVEGQLQGSYFVSCARCLEKVNIEVNSPFRLVLLPTPRFSPGEMELGQDDLDTIYYDGDPIDLEPHLWDQVILSVPQQPICSQDCKGISVSVPGVSLGDSACESGFAVLKTLSLPDGSKTPR